MLVLDGWRGIACICVLFYHCGASLHWGSVALQGYVGVHLFFVLSGYLLYKPFLDSIPNSPNLWSYLARRILRIYPPYLVSLLLFTGFRYVVNTASGPPTAGNFIAHALLIFNYGPSDWFFSINDVYWTLAIEFQYYILLPITVGLINWLSPFRKTTIYGLVAPCIFMLCGPLSRLIEFNLRHDSADAVKFVSVTSYLDLFGCGMLLRTLSNDFTWSPNRRQAFAFEAMSLLGVIASITWAHNTGGWQSSESALTTLFNPLLTAIFIAIALWVSLRNKSIYSRLLSSPSLVWIGTISYSVYLYHTGVQFFVFKIGIKPPGGWTAMTFANAIVSLPVVLLVAHIAFLLTEKPFLTVAANLRKTQQTTA